MISLTADLSPLRMALDASAGLVVISLHGYFFALAAKALKDKGPYYDGRLTADPTAHVDIFALLGMVLAGTAWLKPMDIRPTDIRGGIWGIAVAAGIALLASFLLGRLVVFSQPLILAVTPPDMLQGTVAWFSTFVRISDRVALFNLLPVFSLTAAHLVRPCLPRLIDIHVGWSSALTLGLACALELWLW